MKIMLSVPMVERYLSTMQMGFEYAAMIVIIGLTLYDSVQ